MRSCRIHCCIEKIRSYFSRPHHALAAWCRSRRQPTAVLWALLFTHPEENATITLQDNADVMEAWMERYFNTEGLCRPDKHYMVRLDERLHEIKRLFVDREKYFVINRGRQYGKTTTMWALKKYLEKEYMVLALDFQGIGTEEFADASAFSHAFASVVLEVIDNAEAVGQDFAFRPLRELAVTICRKACKAKIMCNNINVN